MQHKVTMLNIKNKVFWKTNYVPYPALKVLNILLNTLASL